MEHEPQHAAPLGANTTVTASLVMQVIAVVVASLMTYAAVNSRVAVVEAQQSEVKAQLQTIDTSLRDINRNIYELLKIEASRHVDTSDSRR